MKLIIKLLVAFHIPKILKIVDVLIKEGKSKHNALEVHSEENSIIEYVSNLLGKIYATGAGVDNHFEEDFLVIENTISNRFIEKFNFGTKKSLTDYIDWFIPKSESDILEMKNNINKYKSRSDNFNAKRDYGQLDKLAKLLNFFLHSHGSGIPKVFRRAMNKKTLFFLHL